MSTEAPVWGEATGVERASHLFADAFGADRGRAPHVFAAPGRVNLIGEHTDYNSGLCLPMALPTRTYVAAAPRADRVLRMVSGQEGGEVVEIPIDAIGLAGSPGSVDGWPGYAAGVLWALEQAGHGPLPGLDLAVESCVPYAAGLSSSAALECAVAMAVDELAGLGLAGSEEGRRRLVQACVRAENDIAGAATGGMDQTASLLARPGHALLLDTRDWGTRHVPVDLEAAGLRLLITDTRASHTLSDGQYGSRRQECEESVRRLGVGSLREVDPSALDEAERRVGDPTLARRVRHVVTEIARVTDAVAALGSAQAGRTADEGFPALARLMDQSHASMRDDFEISCPELDLSVEAARSSGAMGARMTGGGFGGSSIALVPEGALTECTAQISAAFRDNGFAEPAFLVATPAGAATQLA
ncbi:MAG: galactokinase [Micrococcales bacterium]|nr:galactokinase [Micrococcales bacterium]